MDVKTRITELYTEVKKYYSPEILEIITELEVERLQTSFHIFQKKYIDHESARSGAEKIVQKLKYKNKDFAYVSGEKDFEIEQHLLLLKLYHELGGLKLGFKIPNVYLIKDNYLMDWIDIDKSQNKHKLAKCCNFTLFISDEVQKNIGKLFGMELNVDGKILSDYEIYIDKTDNLPTIVDFGGYLNIDEEKENFSFRGYISKYDPLRVSQKMKEGIIEVLNEENKIKLSVLIEETNADSYIIRDINGNFTTKLGDKYLKKYLKYKHKYLELKRNISIE
jgi:hypothetical protein